jgi:hypothetical protein
MRAPCAIDAADQRLKETRGAPDQPQHREDPHTAAGLDHATNGLADHVVLIIRHDEDVVTDAVDHEVANPRGIEEGRPDGDQQEQQRKEGEKGVIRERGRPLAAVDGGVLDQGQPEHPQRGASRVAIGCGCTGRHRGAL